VIAAALSVPDPFLHEAVAPCTDWSLEILPKHAEAVRDLPDYIREIYVTVIPETPWAEVVAAVAGAGYTYVTLDLEGLRSGNLNLALNGGKPDGG